MKPEQYLQEVFGLSPSEKLLEDFSCFYDSSLVQPAHMYLTPKYLCFHVHGQKEKGQVIPWTDIVEMKKKNTAKVIPNALSIITRDKEEYFFSFINRHHCFKALQKAWKGKDSTSDGGEGAKEDKKREKSADKKFPKTSITKSMQEMQLEEENTIQPITDKKIEDVYEFKKELGTGAFSVVHSAIHKQTKVERAVKTIDKSAIKEKKEMLQREVDILKRIQHPNIIAVVEIYETPKATGGELFDSIVSKGKYSEADAARLVAQLADAVGYLHRKGIVHRDLKPENLLLESKDENSRVKIADFGLSKMMEATTVLVTACGTPGYVAPEVLAGDGYNQEVDCWSIGVITYILLCGFPPFYAQDNTKLFEKIMAGAYSFPSPYWDKISEEAKDLIRHLLVVDPKKRYTSAQVLQHPWITGKAGGNADLTDALATLKKTTEEERKYSVVMSQSSAARLALAAQDKAQ